ncbi:MAG: saccharopine dehydrogenase [Chlorobi bacterium]|nr:saccharopine dehydrogenase [Chlorobiota bacterium]
MQKKIIVLGAGLVGNVMAIDLSKKYDVTSADISAEALKPLSENHSIKTIQKDLSTESGIKSVIKDFDLVVGAMPGFMGYQTAKWVIESGINLVDISFFPENPFTLDGLAKKNNVTFIMDCGVAPGLGNIILGYYNTKMNICDYKCFVGGLPVVREWPYEYKAVFSPIDVIEEYIRPARYIEHGKLVVKEALSDPELLYFDNVGTLEAWNSDGLRTLMKTMKIPNMIEKTMRYPGAIEYLKVLRESGFFSYDEIDVKGKKIRPVDLTASLLFPKWKLKPGEEDMTIMRIEIKGEKNEEKQNLKIDLFDKYDKKTDTISMARTTGYTCTAAANLVIEGKFNRKGMCPPEYIGENEENYKYIIDYLAERDVNLIF